MLKSLARALFLEARLMVLDDIFSGLDHPTAMAIFKDLFGKDGLLRQSECTVILSTHLRKNPSLILSYFT